MLMGISCFKKLRQCITENCPNSHSKQNGDGNVEKLRHLRFSSLRHACKGRKQHDHKDVITGSSCHDHLGDPFPGSVFFLHQAQHSGNNHCRGNRRQNRAHYSGFCPRHCQKHRGKQYIAQDLKAGRYKGQQHSRPSHLL